MAVVPTPVHHMTLRKVDGGVEVEVRDGPPIEPYRIAAIDEAAPGASAKEPKKLATGRYWTDGGFAKDAAGKPE